MAQISIRILNLALFSMCCFLTAGVINHAVDRWFLSGQTHEVRGKPVAPHGTFGREAGATILGRDLFGTNIAVEPASAPSGSAAGGTQIVASPLPLLLLGTVVGHPEHLSEAVILETRKNKHMVLRLGELLDFHPQVSVYAIEPRRVLLKSERGIEELLLETGMRLPHVAAGPTPEKLEPFARSRNHPLRSTFELSLNRPSIVRPETLDAMNRMAMHFADDLEPAYGSNGEIEGLRVTEITDGGLLQEAGVTHDDLIQGVNGVKITTADAAQRVLRDLASCQAMTGMILGPTGTRSVEFTTELLKKFDCTE